MGCVYDFGRSIQFSWDRRCVKIARIRRAQAVFGLHARSALAGKFAVSSSFGVRVAMGTQKGFPASRSAVYFYLDARAKPPPRKSSHGRADFQFTLSNSRVNIAK